MAESVTFGCSCGRSIGPEPIPYSGHIVCQCGREFYGDIGSQDGRWALERHRSVPHPPPAEREGKP